MKKKKAISKLSLKKMHITELDGQDSILGGVALTAASCICPPRTYAANCTLATNCFNVASIYESICFSRCETSCHCQPV